MKKILKANRGFTIVELLVVIVVIGILAAITMVSYNGVTSKANKASSQQAASNFAAKAEVYYADGPTSNYPIHLSTLTSAPTTSTYYMSGVTYAAMGSTDAEYSVGVNPATPAAPTNNSGILYLLCGTGATDAKPANYAAITAVTGYKVFYWDYTTSAITTTPNTGGGVTSGTVGTKNVACIPAAS